MKLDQFKDVYLVIDRANDSFVQKQFVSQGDYKGRTLTVQVTNNGSVGEVPGLNLNLNWHNETSGLTDLTAFTILDKTNSIFRIEYPENMMTPGKVYASIQVIQDGKVTNLQQFELIVQKLAGQPVGIAKKAEFSALVAVLADSNKFRTDIDSLSANKVDKNGNEQVTLPMLSQEVKTAMTGGSVAVVGDNAVNTSNIVDKAVTANKTNFVDADVNIANPANILNGYYAASGGIVRHVSDSAHKCILIPVASDYWYSVNVTNTFSRNFSHAVDEKMKQVSLFSNLESDSASVFKTTPTTRFIAITVDSTFDLAKLVMMQKRENILNYTAKEWPYNQPKNVRIPGLQVGGSPIEDLKNPSYKDVISKKSEILKAFEFYSFPGAATTGNTWSGSDMSHGIYTRFFESNFEETMIDIDVTINGLTNADVLLIYRIQDNTRKYVSLFEATSSFKTTLSFDASNLAIYNNAKDFAILVRNRGTVEGSFTINNLLVYTDEMRKASFYADNLKDVLLNIDEKFNEIKPIEETILTSPSGNKFQLMVSNDGSLTVKSLSFHKINVSGNSLVNGIYQGSHGDREFGMCASNSKHDFNHLIQQAILAKNPDAKFTQTQISGIEMAADQAGYEAYRDSIANSYTADTDLIILQIGDNTQEHIETFKKTFPQFLTWLKGKCPIANIVVVGSWFSKAFGYPVVKQCASDADLTFVDINALNTTENQSASGAIITFDDGATVTAKDSWIRHPGDLGHQKIADKIIKHVGI